MECGDPEVGRRVEERAAAFAAWALRNPGKRGQVRLSFYEKRQRQSWFRCAAAADAGRAGSSPAAPGLPSLLREPALRLG